MIAFHKPPPRPVRLPRLRDASIRTKFVLAMLIISLSSTALVGGVAYGRLMRKFDDLVLQSAQQNFSQDVRAYFQAYGSWEEAQRHETFPAFSERRRRSMGLPLAKGPADHDWEALFPKAGKPQLAPLATPRLPLLPGENLRRPPFLFYLFDSQERALLPLAPYRVGDTIQRGEHESVLPIESDGRVLAYFSPQGHINYSDLDLGYLAAIREALIYGTTAAVLLTLVLGLAFGNRLSAALRRLTAAARAMAQGELKQQIAVTSRDEVGVLAEAFNRMSDELVRSHDELRQAHEQVQQQAEQLKELSVRDALTGLHNRRFFDEQAQNLFTLSARYRRPFTVMLGDIDHFKSINDRYSHAAGDAVLRQISEILRSRARAADIVARYGGEEFAIAFPETPLTQAAAACETLRQRIESFPWHSLHPDLKVTMSMGLCGDIDAENIDAMLGAADEMLYRAKSAGRNRICTENGEAVSH